MKMLEPDEIELDVVYVDPNDEDWGKFDDDYEDEVDWDD